MDIQARAAAAFAKKWAGHGDEKQESQRFWLDLLQSVYGIEKPTDFVRFEERVKLSHTSFIDIMIPSTHTMIEQKSRTKSLTEPDPPVGWYVAETVRAGKALFRGAAVLRAAAMDHHMQLHGVRYLRYGAAK